MDDDFSVTAFVVIVKTMEALGVQRLLLKLHAPLLAATVTYAH